jgi:hypothetical protein
LSCPFILPALWTISQYLIEYFGKPMSMKNFAYMPWGAIFLLSWLVRVAFTLTDMFVPNGFLHVIELVVSGVEIASFVCWLLAVLIRGKLRGIGATES